MRTAMVSLVLAVSAGFLVSAEEQKSPTDDQNNAKSEKTLTAAEKEKIEFVHDQITEIRSGLESINEMNEVTVKSYPYDKKGVCIEVSWREGKKSFLLFKGKKYILTLIDEEGNGEVKRADFVYKDTTDRDNQITVKKVFRLPFAEPLKETICSLFLRVEKFVKEDAKNSGKKLCDKFDIKAFYESYVKQPILDRLK